MSKGLFIVFEGVDGSGKSTQLDLLNKYLTARQIPACTTREPGGTPVGEKIREFLLDPVFQEMQGHTESLLYAAARAQLVAQVICPALEQGTVVLCDRYIDSSLAYQGYGRGLDIEFLKKINELGTGGLKPHVTFLLSLPPEEGLARSRRTKSADRLENEAMDFHRRVWTGYLALARQNESYIVLDARRTIEELHKEICSVIGGMMGV